ncbi:hypothetical protein KR50_29650 [Jeotgalibacillus campisalis]|uniref:Uncharacterized protein n=1 Tax=Jeotgalibacillus campisalis TaxID=220754 RepID=A0A0C2R7R4_9BACL|nr:hypothetical protein KR50_29650 [Jeotgalibacillus campisalis]
MAVILGLIGDIFAAIAGSFSQAIDKEKEKNNESDPLE